MRKLDAKGSRKVTVTALPLPWSATDIGTGMLAGSSAHSGGTFTQASSGIISGTGTVPNTWVRLVRTGTTINAYKSSNGTAWTLVGSATTTPFASICYIGLAVSSGSTTTLNTSQFSNVTITP